MGTGSPRESMMLIKTGDSKGYIKLYKEGDKYWFIEKMTSDKREERESYKVYSDKESVIEMVIACEWATWHERYWLPSMAAFIKEYFGEELFVLVALENL